MDYTAIAFFLLAAGAVATAILTITRRNPVSAAMFLVVHFVCLSGLYLTLQAQLLAALQVIVYAGAIMVLVLFVIMLLNMGDEEKLAERVNQRRILPMALGLAFALQLAIVFLSEPSPQFAKMAENAGEIGTVESIGQTMFTTYLFPFEAVSLLLLAAIIGAIILAKRRLVTN